MRTLFSIGFVACCIFSGGSVDKRAGKAEEMWHDRSTAGETRDL